MKVVFVDNFYYVRVHGKVAVEISPHLGLMTLATILRNAGHQVKIFDPKLLFDDGRWPIPDGEFLDAWAQRLLADAADVIGFTALGRTLPYAVRVAERIKKHRPSQKVIIGGPHATIIGEPLLENFECFDVVVRYEAEHNIVDLVNRLGSGGPLDDIPNLVIRKGDGVENTLRISLLTDMDKLPRPALDLYPEKRLRESDMALEAGRGCPFACTFCSTANFFQRRYRLKSNDRLLAEMEDARARYGVNVFNLNHDLFGLNKKTLREFCSLVTGRGFDWKCSMRPDTLELEMLDELVAAGCVDIYFGVETGSQRMQAIVKKKLDLDATRVTVQKVAASGLTCTTSYITGFPEETAADQDATLDMIGEMLSIHAHHVRVQLHILSPEPGSEMASRSQKILYDGFGPELDALVDPALVKQSPEIFSVFYHFETLLPRWLIVWSSAFVTYLVPEVGTSLVVHFCENVYGGSLARMFHDIVPSDPGQTDAFEDVVSQLWRGLEWAAEAKRAQHPHMAELVRFSRAVSHASADSFAALTEPNGSPNYLIARFDVNAALLAQRVLDSPRLSLPDAMTARGEFWQMFHLDDQGVLAVSGLPCETGQALSAFASSADAERRRLVEAIPGMPMFMVKPEGFDQLVSGEAYVE